MFPPCYPSWAPTHSSTAAGETRSKCKKILKDHFIPLPKTLGRFSHNNVHEFCSPSEPTRCPRASLWLPAAPPGAASAQSFSLAHFTNSLPPSRAPHPELSEWLLSIQFTELVLSGPQGWVGCHLLRETVSDHSGQSGHFWLQGSLSGILPILSHSNTLFFQSTNIYTAPTMCPTPFQVQGIQQGNNIELGTACNYIVTYLCMQCNDSFTCEFLHYSHG